MHRMHVMQMIMLMTVLYKFYHIKILETPACTVLRILAIVIALSLLFKALKLIQ